MHLQLVKEKEALESELARTTAAYESGSDWEFNVRSVGPDDGSDGAPRRAMTVHGQVPQCLAICCCCSNYLTTCKVL